MAATKIEWAEKVWNPVVGCSKVSEGCANCYAERFAVRLAAMGQEKYQRVVTPKGYAQDGKQRWTGSIYCDKSALEEPLHWRKPRRIFVSSMGDLLHKAVSRTFIGRVIDVAERCKQHTFLILTKRPENAEWPAYPPNVWLGVTVENDKHEDRIDTLRQIPAAHKFISFEPLLGGIGGVDLTGIDWVIVGGESGPGARPMHPDWVRSIRDQCKAAGVPFFFKQFGEWLADSQMSEKQKSLIDGDFWPNRVYHFYGAKDNLFRIGKKAAGRLLDGQLHEEMPGR